MIERIAGKTANQIMANVGMKVINPSVSSEVYMQCGNGNFYYCDKHGNIQESAVGATHIKVIRTGSDFEYYIAGILPIPKSKLIQTN
jgi:hypothetical protein